MLSEPLMQPLQLDHSRGQKHMLALCRTMAAVRLTLVSLAAEQHKAAFPGINTQLQWAGRPWPLCQGVYESWVVQRPWGDTVYLLKRQQAAAGSHSAGGVAAGTQTQPEKLVAKFWQPQGDNAIGDIVQKAWHRQGVAPEVVSASKLPCAKEHPSAAYLPAHCCRHGALHENATCDMPGGPYWQKKPVNMSAACMLISVTSQARLAFFCLPGGHLQGRILAAHHHAVPGARGGLGAPGMVCPGVWQYARRG